jgi:hypothetical protein
LPGSISIKTAPNNNPPSKYQGKLDAAKKTIKEKRGADAGKAPGNPGRHIIRTAPRYDNRILF